MRTKEREDWRSIENDREKYNAYLCSREWGVLKKKVHKRSGGKCERCGYHQGAAVHHLTYERKYKEELDDLQHLCEGCHSFVHGESDVDPTGDALRTAIYGWLKTFDVESLEHLYGFLMGQALLDCAHGKRGGPPGNELEMIPTFAIGFMQGSMLTSDQLIGCSTEGSNEVQVPKVLAILKEKSHWKDCIRESPDQEEDS